MASPASSIASNLSLERLRRGDMSLDEYLDEQVELAIGQLPFKLTHVRIAELRVALRETLRTDPVMTELIEQVTGQSPQPL
jgi:hypothetical protein